MINTLMLRNGEVHILDLIIPSSIYWTKCGASFEKQDRINIISADDVFPGICKDCSSIHSEQYRIDLEYNLSFARSPSQPKNNRFLIQHKKNYRGPKAKFKNINSRVWSKLTKYQRLVDRKQNHE